VQIRWMTLFLDFPAEEFDAGVEYWSRITGTRRSELRGGEHEFATLLPAQGHPYLRVQRLGSGPARCHLDLHIAPAERSEAVALAGRLGAVHEFAGGEHDIFTSPGGFPFCLVPWEGPDVESQVPPPNRMVGLATSARLDQLALDIPPAFWESEGAFWAALTGWERFHLEDSEFARLWVPAELPLKLLLQRLDDEAPAVSAHPDFAVPRRAALAPHHAALGARVGPANDEWTVMTDPLGRAYCLTGRPLTP
jgi:hypothetical protein